MHPAAARHEDKATTSLSDWKLPAQTDADGGKGALEFFIRGLMRIDAAIDCAKEEVSVIAHADFRIEKPQREFGEASHVRNGDHPRPRTVRTVVRIAARSIGCRAETPAIGAFRATRETYVTPKGGRQTIAFADGSRVELNTDTILKIEISAKERLAWLEKGEAYFHQLSPFQSLSDRPAVQPRLSRLRVGP